MSLDNRSQSVIEKSWNKIMNWDADQFDEEDDLPLTEWAQLGAEYNTAIEQTQMLLMKIALNDSVNFEDIDAWNDYAFENDDDLDFGSDDEGIECDDTMNEEPQKPKISYSTAIETVNNLIKWSEESALFSTKHISNVIFHSKRYSFIQFEKESQTKQHY
jgi:hypothetical protein